MKIEKIKTHSFIILDATCSPSVTERNNFDI